MQKRCPFLRLTGYNTRLHKPNKRKDSTVNNSTIAWKTRAQLDDFMVKIMEFLDGRPVLAFFGRRLHRISACLATTRARKRGPCPRSSLPVASIALRQWRGGRMGCSASMTARAFGAVPKPTGRKMTSTLCHSKPPFVMVRISFEGCLSKSLCTASVDFPGLRAQIHIPSERATIMADMTFRSMRRVSLSSW